MYTTKNTCILWLISDEEEVEEFKRIISNPGVRNKLTLKGYLHMTYMPKMDCESGWDCVATDCELSYAEVNYVRNRIEKFKKNLDSAREPAKGNLYYEIEHFYFKKNKIINGIIRTSTQISRKICNKRRIGNHKIANGQWNF
jgi:hypothetical protein